MSLAVDLVFVMLAIAAMLSVVATALAVQSRDLLKAIIFSALQSVAYTLMYFLTHGSRHSVGVCGSHCRDIPVGTRLTDKGWVHVLHVVEESVRRIAPRIAGVQR